MSADLTLLRDSIHRVRNLSGDNTEDEDRVAVEQILAVLDDNVKDSTGIWEQVYEAIRNAYFGGD